MIPNWELSNLLRELYEKHPNIPDPPPPPGKRKEPKSSSPPPPPPKKNKHPLPKPVYPGSAEDKRKKARAKEREVQDKKNAEQKKLERSGRNRSPFGDSVVRTRWI